MRTNRRRSDAHLAGIVGAKVSVTLEIEATVPDGVPENVVRTVTENSRTLKFTSFGFERNSGFVNRMLRATRLNVRNRYGARPSTTRCTEAARCRPCQAPPDRYLRLADT